MGRLKLRRLKNPKPYVRKEDQPEPRRVRIELRKERKAANGRNSAEWIAAGEYLQHLRLRAGLTQRELAAKLGYLRLQDISRIEKGRMRVTPDRLELLAHVLKIGSRKLTKDLLRWYSPQEHRLLFPRGLKNMPALAASFDERKLERGPRPPSYVST